MGGYTESKIMRRALLMLSLLAMMTSCGGGGTPPRSAPSPLLGGVLPDFEQKSLNGTLISTASMEGRVLVVQFFSRSCVACKRTLSAAQAVAADNPDVTIIGVSQDKSEVEARATASQQQLTFPIVHDPEQRLASRFQVTEVPATFVAAGDGRIKWVGAANQNPNDLENAIDSATQ
jgi:peroxiredoxin